MSRKKEVIPDYQTEVFNGKEYYRTRIKDADGKRVAIYGSSCKELHLLFKFLFAIFFVSELIIIR